MEILLSQRHNTANIMTLKDYCRLDERKPLRNTFDVEESNNDPFERITRIVNQYLLTLPEKIKKGKRRVHYYYGSEYVGEKVSLYTHNKKLQKYHTDKDRHIKAHYGNPFSQIEVDTYERSITRKGDRITIKKYHQTKVRNVNSIYFKKRTNIVSLTFDLNTGNFVTVISSKSGRSTGKQFRTNTFQTLEIVINQILSNEHIDWNNKLFTDDESDTFIKEYRKLLNLDDNINLFKSIVTKFVELKKIKVPNDYFDLLTTHYPTEKFLKKNDRKLAASILDAIGIKSKVTIKMLHDNLNLNLSLLYRICKLLGSDFSKYIGNVDSNLFTKLERSYAQYEGIRYANMLPKQKEIQQKDKEAICFVLNDLVKNGNSHEKTDSFFNILTDHIDMMEKIRPYNPSIRINAKTWVDFNIEHSEFVKIINLIRKGWVTEYVFNDKMVQDIEKPITIELNIGDEINPEMVTETFYPFILKREDDYAEEGAFMHHCVATYSDKDRSIIVSVRTEDAKDRVTCEFTTQTGQMVQARHFCNKQPPADMMLAIDQLKLKTTKYARLGLLNCIEKKKTQVKINGVEVPKPERTPRLNEHLFNYEVPF